jgi:ABC-type branched-chain amino acid transport system, permease component
MKVLCFALFACAFNLLIGYVGLLSFGHALFFGWASYISAHAAKVWGLTPELAILAGTATAVVLGIVVGALAIRRQGIYFAMITLALAQMMYFFAVQAPFTHGEDGIQAVPRGRLFGIIDLADQTNMYVTVLVIFLACFLLIYRIINSPFGEVLKAIRRTSRAPFRSAIRLTATNSWHLCCRRPSPVLPAPPRRWCSSSPRSRTWTGRCRVKWC